MHFFRLTITLAVAAFSAPIVHAQACEGGAYLNPQLFRGEAAHQSAVAEQEMNAFIGRTGLPASPLYPIKRIDDVTSSGRAPYCWIYSNPVVGLLSGYKVAVVNSEVIQPAVLAITAVMPGGKRDLAAVPLKSLSEAEQKAILDQLRRSKCMGTASGIEAAVAKAEGICAYVEDVAPQVAVGQQGLIARAAYAWEEQAWSGIATREASALKASMQGLAGKTDTVHAARLVVVPTKHTSFGFGLYVHPSVSDATIKKAVATFQGLSSPSRPLAIALDLGPQFSFIVPTTAQVDKMAEAIGFRK